MHNQTHQILLEHFSVSAGGGKNKINPFMCKIPCVALLVIFCCALAKSTNTYTQFMCNNAAN